MKSTSSGVLFSLTAGQEEWYTKEKFYKEV